MRTLVALLALVLASLPIAVAAAPTPLVSHRALNRFYPSYDSTFGRAVAVSGSQVLVGDPGHLGGDGIAYVFDARSGEIRRAPDGVSYDPPLFGRHVGFLGSAPLVGGHGGFLLFDSPPPAPGRLFREPDSGDDNPPIGFGRALIALDANRILVGYPYGPNAPGRVLVIDAGTGAVTATLTAPTPAVGDHFGHAIAVTANAILVGAPFGDADADTFQPTGSEAAAVHVFDRSTLTWQRALSGARSPGSLFGHAIATNDTTVVVGAPGEHRSAEREGAAYLFRLATGTLHRRIANRNPPFVHDHFGFAVAALPERIVVGAPYDDTADERHESDTPESGMAYVFDLDGALLQTLVGGHRDAGFGWSMAALGRGVAIGAPSPPEGSGYVALYSPCGDGVVDLAESCDDGNTIDGDGCDGNCTLTACGNGIVTAGEDCDFGPETGKFGSVCMWGCRRNVCGDGIALPNQGCDDGNQIDGDGCDSDCRPSTCFGGGSIMRARLTVENWGPPFGDEHTHLSGRIVFPADAPPLTFDPATRGVQLRADVMALDAREGPSYVPVAGMWEELAIPPGLRGGGCTPADGWRVRSRGRLQTYTNPSKRLRPPTCVEYLGGIVERLHFGLWRGKGGLDFRADTHQEAVAYEVEPTSARIVMILGAEPTAGRGGECATQTLTKCRVDRGSKRLRCRD